VVCAAAIFSALSSVFVFCKFNFSHAILAASNSALFFVFCQFGVQYDCPPTVNVQKKPLGFLS